MSAWLIGLTTLIYLGTAVALYHEGRTGMALAFFGYALANAGFIYDVLTKEQ